MEGKMSYDVQDSNIDNRQVERLVEHLKQARDIAHSLRIQGMESRSFYVLAKELDSQLTEAIGEFEPYYIDPASEPCGCEHRNWDEYFDKCDDCGLTRDTTANL
jgi:hypothetical protein